MLLCVGVLFFAGCGAKDGALKGDETAGEEQAETEDPPVLEEEGVSDTVNIENTMADSDRESAEKAQALYEAQIRHYYGGVLSQIVALKQLPDGEMDTWALDNGYEEMENNDFAVADIDQDGREELIIKNTAASMAGMFEMVYDYNPVSGELKREFCDFPALTYYDNGIIKAEWSHNQDPGEFWPFTLYRYEEGSDCYVEVGSVDTWDKALREEYSYEYEDYKYNQADFDEWLEGLLKAQKSFL